MLKIFANEYKRSLIFSYSLTFTLNIDGYNSLNKKNIVNYGIQDYIILVAHI